MWHGYLEQLGSRDKRKTLAPPLNCFCGKYFYWQLMRENGSYFMDRTREIIELTCEMENNNRVFRVSPRRDKKICPLHHLCKTLNKSGMARVFIDLNAYPDLIDFIGALTTLTPKALESNADQWLKIFSGFHKLQPRLSMDPDDNLNAILELAVGETDTLSVLTEGLAHAM